MANTHTAIAGTLTEYWFGANNIILNLIHLLEYYNNRIKQPIYFTAYYNIIQISTKYVVTWFYFIFDVFIMKIYD